MAVKSDFGEPIFTRYLYLVWSVSNIIDTYTHRTLFLDSQGISTVIQYVLKLSSLWNSSAQLIVCDRGHIQWDICHFKPLISHCPFLFSVCSYSSEMWIIQVLKYLPNSLSFPNFIETRLPAFLTTSDYGYAWSNQNWKMQFLLCVSQLTHSLLMCLAP